MSNQSRATYDAWRKTQVREVGLQTQLKAEAMLDKQSAEALIEVNDERSGQRRFVRQGVAKVLEARRYMTKPKIYIDLGAK